MNDFTCVSRLMLSLTCSHVTELYEEMICPGDVHKCGDSCRSPDGPQGGGRKLGV